MTVIAIRKHKTYIQLACDSQKSHGRYGKMTNKSGSKIFKDNCKINEVNGMYFGGAGWSSHSLQFKEFLRTNTPKGSRLDDIESFMLKFYDERISKDSSFNMNYNQYLFVYDKKMFHICGCDIYEIEEYDAVGSGMFEARTAMYLDKSAKEACEVSAELSHGVGGKIETIRIPL